MPPAKVPHGIRDKFEKALDKIYATGTPVDGVGLKVASQVVPVVKMRNGEADVRPCIN